MSADAEILATWTTLLEPRCQPLLQAVADAGCEDAAAVTRLRRAWPADLVAAAIELTRARRKAAAKFPGRDDLVADVAGVEQATAATVADHKAARFALLGPRRVWDLCCGIGGDAMSLARSCEVTGVDRSALRAWMCGRNAGCATEVADVTGVDVRGGAFHLDPARRDGGRRRWRYDDYVPGPEAIERLLRDASAGAVKLGPGVDLERLPDPRRHEIELISDGGTLVQAVLWSGDLVRAAGERTATLLPQGVQLTGMPTPPLAAEEERFRELLHVPDPAVERAGLLGLLCERAGLVAPLPALGLLTSDASPATSLLTSYRVHATLPWRPRKVKAWLDEHGAGIVTVKTRGRAVDTDSAQQQLRGTGDEPYTVFALRMGRRIQAIVTTRMESA